MSKTGIYQTTAEIAGVNDFGDEPEVIIMTQGSLNGLLENDTFSYVGDLRYAPSGIAGYVDPENPVLPNDTAGYFLRVTMGSTDQDTSTFFNNSELEGF